MAQYQIHLAVNIEVGSDEEAMEVAGRLEEFLGMHCETTTLGETTEIIELEEDEDISVDNLSDIAYTTETV